MAIITDPDSLDRNQVIFGTTNLKISMYPVGSTVVTQKTDGVSTIATGTFTSATGDFVTNTVSAGDIVSIKTGADAGHYVVLTRDSATQLTLVTDAEFTGFSANGTNLIYDVRDPSGGTITDGVTMQAIYSYAKEEWRSDSATYGGDDLIRHPFAFEPITSEQFEIGGGASHDDWEWFNAYTRKKTRTGGWAKKDAGGTSINEYTGIVTLGSLDSDAQVYYQQISSATAPNNFTFQGPVNEPLFVWDAGSNRRSYLKLFARKKGRTYAQAAISDIGVTTIGTIVNRFPLAHATDTAIAALDGEILGTIPFRSQATIVSGSNGVKSSAGVTFTSTGANFVTNLAAIGDTLRITSGTEQGYYTISSVDSETQLTIATDAEYTTWADSETSLTYTVLSTYKVRAKTDGALADVSTVTGTLTSASSNFTTAGVVADDLVIITEAASGFRGVYKVISKDSATVLTLNTTDKAFTSVSSIDFSVVRAGMYLQYKSESITLGSTGNITFANAGPDTITRASGSWISDGVTAGDIITITGSVSNDGSYTVASRTATIATLVATDELTAEGPLAVTTTASTPFKRSIGGVTYGYNWRLLGNDGSLSDCYEFIQYSLRQTTDIDHGPGTSRGDVTDTLMSYASPTGTGLNLYIDDLLGTDQNSATFKDATNASRVFPFLAAGTLSFNTNLVADTSAKYWLFFTTNPTGNFGDLTAVVVQDNDDIAIQGTVSGNASISFTFDYDGNVQGGRTAATNAAVTLVAMGLDTAQYVVSTGTITRSTSNNITAVSALERNYSNA
jgi:hypothetical protein